MERVKFKDICEKIGSGSTPRGGKEVYCENGVSFVRSQNILDFSFSDDGLVYINQDQAKKMNNVEVLEGDVLLNITGDSVARATMINPVYLPARVNQHVTIIRAKKGVAISSYLLYFLQWRKEYLLQSASAGATRNALTKGMIENLVIDLPNLEIQQKVVAILDKIQEKMAINQRINKNLEQQAQAIYAKMFAENKTTTPATIADVSINVTDGVHNTVHDDPTGEYLLLSCKNIKGGSLNIGSLERRINIETFEKLRRRTKLAKGDILISSVGTVGELLLLNEEPFNYEFQRSVAMIKPNSNIVSPAYLYESLIFKRSELINAAHGAVQQCLFIADIAGFPIEVPQQTDLLKFDAIVTPMLDIISANENENHKLAEIRDSLLPKLMSGELDVTDLDL